MSESEQNRLLNNCTKPVPGVTGIVVTEMGTSNNQEAWTMLYSQITKSGTLTSPNSKNYGKLQQQNTPSPDMVNVLQHGQLNQTQNLYIMGMSDSPEPKNNNMEKQPTIGISYENRT